MFLGQYRQGDEVVITQRAYSSVPAAGSLPFDRANPQIRVFRAMTALQYIESREMAAYDHPTLPGLFRLPLFLGDAYLRVGGYVIEVRWQQPGYTTGDPLLVRYHQFEILPGGHGDGIITSMAEIVRPDKRFIMCGTTGGRILRRKNPRVNT